MQTRTRGFTLMEIMVSMTLFTMIGFAVVLLMRTGVDMWLEGNRSSQQEDRIEQSLPRLEEDLRMVVVPTPEKRIPFDPKNPDPRNEPDPLPPQNRFLSGYKIYKQDGKEIACRYLVFVRDIEGLGEIDTYAARAGTNSRAESYIDGINDEEEFRKNDHLPTGGQCEVLWIWLPYKEPEKQGRGAIYRAYRTPIGGAGTFLDPRNFDDLDALEKNIKPTPMVQDVLLFDVYFWTQFTTTWTWSDGEPRIQERPQSADDAKRAGRECGPSKTWDSTRGILRREPKLGFLLSRVEEPYTGSFSDSSDDIWPRMVRVQFAVAEERTELVRGLGPTDNDFTVLAGDFATGRGELFYKPMKIGLEWVQLAGRDPVQRDMFQIHDRGQRGTAAVGHDPGTPVYFGRIFDITITIPSFRDEMD
jgi:prepilin-type N-terminal cleavage/methylation domain-containing protein